MGQKSLIDLWSKPKPKTTGVKRKIDDVDSPKQSSSESKRLKSFELGGEGIKVDDEISTKIRERLGGLDSISKIKKRSRKKEVGVQLKPMHKHIAQLKKEHDDTLLLVEEGYKYRVYADDAAIVSRILGFYLTDGRKYFSEEDDESNEYEQFATCSFPVQSLQRHTKKLVDLGYKVGIVQQMEQSALAKSGKLLKRELTRKFTKATFADEFQVSVDDDVSICNYLFALREQGGGGGKFGIVAVEPSTGDIIYDEFTDGVMLTELETRLLHLQPVEMLLVGECSKRVERLVSNVSQSRSERVIIHRVEAIDKEWKSKLCDHFVNEIDQSEEDNNKEGISKTMDKVLELPELVQQSIESLITHLKEYNMSHIFSLSKNYTSFSSRSEMYLSGDTILSLEIFQNQTDKTSDGSLFELLDQTRTPFGKRLFKKWVAKPLLKRSEIERRSAAVTEMTRPMIKKAGMVASEFKNCIDLEKALANVYYERSSRPQLVKLLNKLQDFVNIDDEENYYRFESEYLNELFDQIPKARDVVLDLLKFIDPRWEEQYENKKQDNIEMFFNTDAWEDEQILTKQFDLQQTEQGLNDHLTELKTQLKIPLTYGTYGDQPYIIELDAKHKTKVPSDWIPFAKLNKIHKYRSPECERLFQEYEKEKSRLVAECQRSYKQYLSKIASHYNELRDLINAVAQIDCIMSLSQLATHDHYSKPVYVNETGIKVTGGRHPTAELVLDVDYIANDIEMNSKNRVKIITGPNMGGKSSYVRQVALIAIMAQIGSYVPAESVEIGPFDAVFTRMGAYDNMIRGQSTFKVELQECQTIMNKATEKSLVILDEVGRGTSTMDGQAIAHAVLSYFITDIQCATLFITHFPALASFSTAFQSNVGCYRMGFEELPGNKVMFTYKLEQGVAAKSYGLNVARIAQLPTDVLTLAETKSNEMEKSTIERHEQLNISQQAEFFDKIFNDRDVGIDDIYQVLQSIV